MEKLRTLSLDWSPNVVMNAFQRFLVYSGLGRLALLTAIAATLILERLLACFAPRRLSIGFTAPTVEPLEDRVLLNTYWWQGSAKNTDWSVATNWLLDTGLSPAAAPTKADDVDFSLTDPFGKGLKVINADSTVNAAFPGGQVKSLTIASGYTGKIILDKKLTVLANRL
jgi:hypothetical protein